MTKLNFFESLSKPALKGLTISACKVAVEELLKQDYSIAISASISWLLLIVASKKFLNIRLQLSKNKFATYKLRPNL